MVPSRTWNTNTSFARVVLLFFSINIVFFVIKGCWSFELHWSLRLHLHRQLGPVRFVAEVPLVALSGQVHPPALFTMMTSRQRPQLYAALCTASDCLQWLLLDAHFQLRAADETAATINTSPDRWFECSLTVLLLGRVIGEWGLRPVVSLREWVTSNLPWSCFNPHRGNCTTAQLYSNPELGFNIKIVFCLY